MFTLLEVAILAEAGAGREVGPDCNLPDVFISEIEFLILR